MSKPTQLITLVRKPEAVEPRPMMMPALLAFLAGVLVVVIQESLKIHFIPLPF